MIRSYLKIAFRNINKNKVNSLINIVGLSIGITCCIIIIIFVNYESNFDSRHSHSALTYRVVQHTKMPEQTLHWNTTAYPLAEALRNDFPELEMVTQSAGPVNRMFSVEGRNGNIFRFEENFVLFVDSYYPRVFDLEWIQGSPESALKDPNSIVLTENIAEKIFGDITLSKPSILGKVIILNGKDPLTITGVVKNPPGNTNLQFNLLIPYEFFKMHNVYQTNNWSGNYQGTTFLVLPDKNIKDDVQDKIAGWKKKYLKPEDDNRISYELQPLSESHTETLYGSSPGGYTMPRYLLQTAYFVALFILIIAIVNFVNLTTAQATSRAKEVGIRKTVGSTRLDLIRQFTFENTVLVIISLALSTVSVHFLISQLNDHLSIINLQLSFEWSNAGLIILIGCLTIILAAFYPAFVLSSFKPIQAIKDKISTGNKSGLTFRKSLTVFQFLIVQLFVIAAMVVAIQMDYFRSKELGFSSEAVISTPVPEFNKIEVFKNSLLQNNKISNVAIGSGPPMAVDGFMLGTTFRLPHQSKEEAQESEMKIGDLNYLDFFDLQLIAGRNFRTTKQAFDEFIVNEKLLKSMGWTPEEAISKKLVINEGEAIIVGVVKDFHNNSLQNEITPCIIMNWNYFQDQAFIKVENTSSGYLPAIREIWEEVFPTSVYRYGFVDDSIEREYQLESLVFNGFTLFSILAITIGCLGLFGLVTFATEQRVKEIGIRKVLGSTVTQIVTMLTRDYVSLVLISCFIAFPIGFYLTNKWLQNFAYGIDTHWWIFALAGFITILIAFITVSFKSIRSALANPVKSLRSE